MGAAFPGSVPRVFGHRGAAGVAPENTLASFRRARADGADVFELDVHATADGEIVVLHDPTLERTTDGGGAVSSLRFAEVVREFPAAPLNIELKQETPSIVDAVVALLRAARTTVVLAAEHDTIMTAIRRAAPDIPTSRGDVEVAAFIDALQQGVVPALPEGAVALQIPP